MVLNFDVILKVRLSPHSGNISIDRTHKEGEKAMADDWAEKVANRIKGEKHDRRRSDELELQRGAKISTQAPQLWKRLLETVKSKVAHLNKLLEDEPQEYLEIKTPTSFMVMI